MYDDPGDLLADTGAMTAGVLARDVGRDVDVADHRRSAPGLAESERDDIRRSAMAEVLAIERSDRACAQERDRDHGLVHSLRREDAPRDFAHAGAREGCSYSVSRYVNGEAHADANSDVTPPLRTG